MVRQEDPAPDVSRPAARVRWLVASDELTWDTLTVDVGMGCMTVYGACHELDYADALSKATYNAILNPTNTTSGEELPLENLTTIWAGIVSIFSLFTNVVATTLIALKAW